MWWCIFLVKKITTISIDEDVLKKAKKELPNFSIFVEECLKSFLGIGNLDLMTIDENRNIIKNAMLKIQILTAKNDGEIAVEHYDSKQQEEAWLKIFNLFRKHQENRSDVVNAGKILNMDSTELYELFEVIESECDKRELVKCSDWGYVKNTYL